MSTGLGPKGLERSRVYVAQRFMESKGLWRESDGLGVQASMGIQSLGVNESMGSKCRGRPSIEGVERTKGSIVFGDPRV